MLIYGLVEAHRDADLAAGEEVDEYRPVAGLREFSAQSILRTLSLVVDFAASLPPGMTVELVEIGGEVEAWGGEEVEILRSGGAGVVPLMKVVERWVEVEVADEVVVNEEGIGDGNEVPYDWKAVMPDDVDYGDWMALTHADWSGGWEGTVERGSGGEGGEMEYAEYGEYGEDGGEGNELLDDWS